jgi:hypothetical protein
MNQDVPQNKIILFACSQRPNVYVHQNSGTKTNLHFSTVIQYSSLCYMQIHRVICFEYSYTLHKFSFDVFANITFRMFYRVHSTCWDMVWLHLYSFSYWSYSNTIIVFQIGSNNAKYIKR